MYNHASQIKNLFWLCFLCRDKWQCYLWQENILESENAPKVLRKVVIIDWLTMNVCNNNFVLLLRPQSQTSWSTTIHPSIHCNLAWPLLLTFKERFLRGFFSTYLSHLLRDFPFYLLFWLFWIFLRTECSYTSRIFSLTLSKPKCHWLPHLIWWYFLTNYFGWNTFCLKLGIKATSRPSLSGQFQFFIYIANQMASNPIVPSSKIDSKTKIKNCFGFS